MKDFRMIRHHLCNPSVQCSINDVSSATKPASTSSFPVPDINNNEDNFEDRMESGEIEKGGERRKNSFLVKEENITRLEFETSDHFRWTKRDGNEYETGSGISSSLEDEKMKKEVSVEEPGLFSSNTCLKVQMIPSSLHPLPSSSKVLFPSTSDYAKDGREVQQPQSHKCCSSSLNSSNSFHSTSLHRLNGVDDEEMNPEGGREVQLQFSDSQNSTGNSISNETEPELVIEFDEIRDDIELIVDIYLFIEKSSWALKSVLW